MWVRPLLLPRASYCEVINISLFNNINISHFESDFTPFCTVSHWLCTNLHRNSLGASFNPEDMVRTPTPLWYVASNCCFEIRSRGDNWWQKICSTCGISASTCLPFQSNRSGSSIRHSYRIVQLFQQQKAAALIYSAHLAVMVTLNLLVDTFCVQQIIEQENLIKQIIFLLQSIVCESTDLDVVKMCL